MARTYATPTRDAVLALLRQRAEDEGEVVPMSAADLADCLEMHRKAIDACIRHCRLPGKPKLLYIAKYKRAEGRGKWAPLYAVGDLPDKNPPRRIPHKVRNREYRARNPVIVRAKDRARHGTPVDHWADQLRAMQR
jgi:hypothetical protein